MENEKELKHKTVDTYAEDMARVIENDKEGLVKKIIHEAEERESEKKNLSPESTKNKVYMFLSFLLVAIALGILFISIWNKSINTVAVPPQFVPLISSEKSFYIEVGGLDKRSIVGSVVNEMERTDLKAGGVEGIYLTVGKQVIGLRTFISLLEMSFVPGPVEFVSEEFLIGVTNMEGKEPFILLKVRSMIDIFDQIRAWEGNMFADLYQLFNVPLSSENNYLLTKSWEDGVIDNKNARILSDTDGNIVMMYVFADEASVVIISGRDGAREVMLRLQQSEIKK